MSPYAECHNGEFRFAQCRYAECRSTTFGGLSGLVGQVQVRLRLGPGWAQVGIGSGLGQV